MERKDGGCSNPSKSGSRSESGSVSDGRSEGGGGGGRGIVAVVRDDSGKGSDDNGCGRRSGRLG